MSTPPERDGIPLSAADFHTLLVLAKAPLYGYAIMKAVALESGGAVTPEIGSLYRILGRLVTKGLVEEAPVPATTEPHPGKQRRYFQLSLLGRRVAQAEASRLNAALDLARHRDLLPGTGGP